MRAVLTGLLLSLVAGGRPLAVVQSSEAEFQTLLSSAESAVTDRQWEEARTRYETLGNRARDAHDELWESRAAAGLGVIAFRQSKYHEARSVMLKALLVFDRLQAAADIANVNRWLGSIAEVIGDRGEAIARYARALETFESLGDVRNRAHVALSLLLLNETGDTADTTSQLKSLQQEAERLGDQDLLGMTLHYWANWLVKRAEYEAAIDKLDAAQACYRAAGNREHLATTFTTLGELYRQHGQLAAALHSYIQALEILQSLNSPRSVVSALNAVAIAYSALGDYQHARPYYERAVSLSEQVGSEAQLQRVRGSFAAMLIEIGDVARGRAMLEQVVLHEPAGLKGMHYAQLSTVYRLEGRFQEALEAAQHAMAACQTEVARVNCIHARLAQARAEVAVGDEPAALEDQRAVLDTIEEIHTRLAASDFLRQGYHRLWEPAYSLAIELQVRRGQWRQALDTAEMARARAFLDLLASRDLHEQRLPTHTEASLTRRVDAFGATLSTDTSAPPPTTADLAVIAARLRSTLVLYWIGDNRIYIWVLSPEAALRGTTVDVPRWKLDSLIRSTSPFDVRSDAPVGGSTILTRGATPIVVSRQKNAAWRALYDLLIKPIARDLPSTPGARLTIVPAGPLLTLPFGALRDPQGRYLIERYALHTVPAAGILPFTAARHHAQARTGEMLLVANPAPPPPIRGEQALPYLPGALAEARAIAGLLPPGRARLLTEADATETRVHDLATGKAVIHFATHAITRDADPLASFLALGSSARGSTDGQLTAQKIYGLTLDADLVVLSACRSGDGLTRGDGLASLARAFFYAGTRSVIASLWDVADEPTRQLLPAFYRAWLHGADKAAALRRAQLHLIRDLRAGRVRVSTSAGELALPESPALWAGFVLLGEPD